MVLLILRRSGQAVAGAVIAFASLWVCGVLDEISGGRAKVVTAILVGVLAVCATALSGVFIEGRGRGVNTRAVLLVSSTVGCAVLISVGCIIGYGRLLVIEAASQGIAGHLYSLGIGMKWALITIATYIAGFAGVGAMSGWAARRPPRSNSSHGNPGDLHSSHHLPT